MSENDISYGGQAVISGVLIQSPKGWSVAVRNQNNEIVKFFKERTPLGEKALVFLNFH
jgi:Predicted metal-dependent enzyme